MCLYDSEARTVRLAASAPGLNGIFFEQVWVPGEDAFLRPGVGGGTVYEQADGSGALELPEVPWPARVIGSPEWAVSIGWAAGGLGTVAVVDLASGSELARWPGRISAVGLLFDRRLDEWGVGIVDGQPAGVVAGAPDCEGSVLHHPGLDAAGVCLEDAQSATLSPDASRVAFARVAGSADHKKEWEIVIRKVGSGRERALGRTLLADPSPPLRWTPDGGHVVVLWPRLGL